jgi:endonuclease G, mitochondrial
MFDAAYRPRLADLAPLVPPVPDLSGIREAVAAPRAAIAARTGYDRGFLGEFVVDLPVIPAALLGDVVPVPDRQDGRLDYTHFSIVMRRSRRLAFFTAVNIDGGSSVSVPRGGDPWALDARIPDDAQTGPDLYTDNDFDRGHLVRREDPNWGPDAATANRDSFTYTNCSPQLSGFNQTTWLSLEDFVLGNTKRWKERATVFTGPVFRDDDPVYRTVPIPLAYWKVVAFLGDDGKPSASAYMIEQDVELGKLSLIFGPFKTYQRSVASIETLTGLSFGDLSARDGFSNEERATGQAIRRTIRQPADILL